MLSRKVKNCHSLLPNSSSLASSVFLCLLIILAVINTSIAENYSEKEKAILAEFRELVKPNLKEEYMKSDAYLFKWLNARNFVLADAKKMFEEALKWRRENRIDSILTEDLSSIYKRAPYYIDGLDNLGRPVATFNPGRWDIRRFILNGEMQKLKRFLDQFLERFRVRIDQVARDIGQTNITQGTIVLDVGGYNLRQHGCLRCVGSLLDWIRNYENYYPGIISDFHLINNPSIFSPLFELLKPVLSTATGRIMKLHGPDKKVWSLEILKVIPANQLREQYGGTKRND